MDNIVLARAGVKRRLKSFTVFTCLQALPKTFTMVLLMCVLDTEVLAVNPHFTFSPLLTVDFESDGNGSIYRANTFNDGGGDLWTRWNISTNPAGPNASGTTSGANFFQAYAGQQGSYAFGGEDMDATDNPLGTGQAGYITLQTLNVSAYQSGTAMVQLLMAASTEGNSRYETPDYVRVEYAFDSDISSGAVTVGSVPTQANLTTGTYSIGGAFYGGVGATGSNLFEDTNLNGTGNADASFLTTTLTDYNFSFSIPVSATTMSIRIVALGGSAEEVVVDNIWIAAEPGAPTTSPEINLKQSTTNISTGGTFGYGSVQIGDSKDVVFTVENTGDGALDITSITPTGTGFTISSAISADPIAASSSATFTVRFRPTATSQTTGSVTIASDDTDEGSYVINFTASVTNAVLSLKLFLEGPLSGNSMSTTINASLPSDPSAVYSGIVSETSSGIPGTAVDWVEVELRTGTSAATKVGTNKAGLLHSDGTITDKDGNSFTMAQVDGGNYYIVIHHRNHLSVMSASALAPAGGVYTYDFTIAQSNSYSGGADGAAEVGAVFAMFAGDADSNNSIGVSDLTDWRTQNGSAYVYGSNGKADFNLDGAINAVDRNDFQQPNSGKQSQVPN